MAEFWAGGVPLSREEILAMPLPARLYHLERIRERIEAEHREWEKLSGQ